VTDVKYELAAIGQLYRDRCDCRACQVSGFDELKNQWVWGGFTMHRSQLTARAVALIYNWWSWADRHGGSAQSRQPGSKSSQHRQLNRAYPVVSHGH
jgi:hypothetical protein